MVTVPSSDGASFQAYLALPSGGRGPGLVLIQEIFGVNAWMRSVADWYAARGFAVICPDLFWRQQPGVELSDQSDADWRRAFELYRGLDVDRAIDDTAASMEFLRRHSACTGKVGGLGFCLGGKLAYLLACRARPDCAIGYYGVGIESSLDEAGGITTPLMLHIAARDAYCTPEAQAKIHARFDADSRITLHDYPDQDHAFARVGGAHYHAPSAELANLRSLEFLLRNLSAASPLATLWEEHIRAEFATRDVNATLDTMVDDAYVNHVPVLTGGVGRAELYEFYSKRFIPKMPPDTTLTPVSRTVGADRLIDEMIFQFTHTIEMDWMLPGVAPTGRRVEVPLVVIVHFRGDKLAHEHIYWDQASVLVQLGLLEPGSLPVAGVASARKVLDPTFKP